MARAYYNEIDPAAAHILRALIDADVIAPGDVDTRSIKDVQPDDLSGYTQCHFFAGGGLWSVAARLAGWPDDRPLWTGSCPCQPFSAAGKGLGTDDPRHLWPDFHRLIRAGRPAVVMGEQVAGKAGRGWFDGVGADLEGDGFAARTVDFPACSVDAPHQRNRMYWIAVADHESNQRGTGLREDRPQHYGDIASDRHGSCAACGGRGRVGPFFPGGMSTICGNCAVVDAPGFRWGEGRAEYELWGGRDTSAGADASGVTQGDAFRPRLEGQRGHGDGGGRQEQDRPVAAADGAERCLSSDANGHRCDGQRIPARQERQRSVFASGDYEGLHADAHRGGRAGRQEDAIRPPFERTSSQRPVLRNGSYWSDADWIACHDGKARRSKPGIRFLVDGLPGRVDLWRVGGNAIVPEAAAEVIAAFMDVYGVPRRAAA